MPERLGPASLWLLANAVGITIFLVLASQAWIEPELAKVPGAGGGDFMIWGMSALPVMLIFVLAHLAVGVAALKRLIENRRWGGVGLLAVTTVAWVIAAFVDNAHHAI
jgi:hypothetical protein